MSHYVDNAGVRWDEVIHYFVVAYNSTPHPNTGFSSCYLMYGREMHLPTQDDLHPTIYDGNSFTVSVCEHLEILKERFKDACDDAGKRREHAHEIIKCSYGRTVCYRSYHPHDLVYIHD